MEGKGQHGASVSHNGSPAIENAAAQEPVFQILIAFIFANPAAPRQCLGQTWDKVTFLISEFVEELF